MNASGVYTITSPSGGQYVGSAINVRLRWHGHRTALRNGRHKNKKLQNAWNKYGERSMHFAVVLICRPSELLLFEQAAIDTIKPRYNICKIAGNSLGTKRSAESNARRSQSMKGIKQTPEFIARRSAGMIGHRVSPEARAKIGTKHKGNSHAAGCSRDTETRAKMSAAQKARFAALRERGIVPTPHLGHTMSQDVRERIASKLAGRKRTAEAVSKHRATLAARRCHMLNSVEYEVKA